MRLRTIPRSFRLIIASAAALLVGGTCGLTIGIYQSRMNAETKLAETAQLGVAPFIALMDEATGVLNSLNALQSKPCTHEEMATMRLFLFHSVNLHDVGRIIDGRPACSALYSEDLLPKSLPDRTVTRADGVTLYRNVAPYWSNTQQVYLISLGNFFVVEDPNQYAHYYQPSIHYESYYKDRYTHQLVRPGGSPPEYPDAIRNRNYRGFINGIHYVTTCDNLNYLCSSAYEPLTDELVSDSLLITGKAVFGGLLTLVPVLIFALIHAQRSSAVQQLQRAIRHKNIQLVYQPIVDLQSGAVVAAEALARWTNEEAEVINPSVFVQLAEENGMMHQLTELVIDTALEEMGGHLRNHPEFLLHINISAADLVNPKFVAQIESKLALAKVSSRSIAIEITETMTARKQEAMDMVSDLRRRGYNTQIDDFGTGYSSLAYLKDLSVDAIKIDRAFTHAIGTEAVTLSILPQLLSMACTLGLKVTVEGIETPEQAAYFAGKKPKIYGQGWLFGKPTPVAKLLEHLEQAEAKRLDSADTKDNTTQDNLV